MNREEKRRAKKGDNKKNTKINTAGANFENEKIDYIGVIDMLIESNKILSISNEYIIILGELKLNKIDTCKYKIIMYSVLSSLKKEMQDRREDKIIGGDITPILRAYKLIKEGKIVIDEYNNELRIIDILSTYSMLAGGIEGRGEKGNIEFINLDNNGKDEKTKNFINKITERIEIDCKNNL